MKYFSNPKNKHWKALDRAIGHLKKTKDTNKFTLRKPKELRMRQSAESDFSSAEDRRSISGNLGAIGECITDWQP